VQTTEADMDSSSVQNYDYESNFKRAEFQEDGGEEGLEHLKNYDYIKELIKERNQMDSDSHASRLLDQGDYYMSGKKLLENICKISIFHLSIVFLLLFLSSFSFAFAKYTHIINFYLNRNPEC
jgi:hypothetical protein